MRRTPVVMLVGGLVVAAVALLWPDVLAAYRLWRTPDPEFVWMSAKEFADRQERLATWLVVRRVAFVAGLALALAGTVRLLRRR